MEINMCTFVDMNDDEVCQIDGGSAFIPIIVNLVVIKLIYDDLKNCYNNGYNEVMSSR